MSTGLALQTTSSVGGLIIVWSDDARRELDCAGAYKLTNRTVSYGVAVASGLWVKLADTDGDGGVITFIIESDRLSWSR